MPEHKCMAIFNVPACIREVGVSIILIFIGDSDLDKYLFFFLLLFCVSS